MERKHHNLRAEGLYKQYGNRWVVSDVDIEVKKGEIIGLLGPNGAGKTTTFYMITGMIKPSKGNIYLDDKENWSVPNNIIEVKICKETLDRAGKWCKPISEIYLENYTPRNKCQKHINAFTKYKE